MPPLTPLPPHKKVLMPRGVLRLSKYNILVYIVYLLQGWALCSKWIASSYLCNLGHCFRGHVLYQIKEFYLCIHTWYLLLNLTPIQSMKSHFIPLWWKFFFNLATTKPKKGLELFCMSNLGFFSKLMVNYFNA